MTPNSTAEAPKTIRPYNAVFTQETLTPSHRNSYFPGLRSYDGASFPHVFNFGWRGTGVPPKSRGRVAGHTAVVRFHVSFETKEKGLTWKLEPFKTRTQSSGTAQH